MKMTSTKKPVRLKNPKQLTELYFLWKFNYAYVIMISNLVEKILSKYQRLFVKKECTKDYALIAKSQGTLQQVVISKEMNKKDHHKIKQLTEEELYMKV
jgi:hypothetical protein